jgi:hypothetical protein
MADKPRNYSANIPKIAGSLPVITDVLIEAGDAVGRTTAGYAKKMSTSEVFAGFSQGRNDNRGGANAAIQARIYQRGEVELAVVGVTGIGNVGDTVYALGENTFTLSSSSSAKTIGKITRHLSGTRCMVFFEGVPVRSL